MSTVDTPTTLPTNTTIVRDQDVQLIPGYAFPETKSASTSEIGIRFQWIATGKILHNSTFWFKGSRGTSQVYVKIRRNDGKVDSEYFQSELCNQEVVQTFVLPSLGNIYQNG